MAWEADIDARAMPIANKEAASIFIGIPFCLAGGEIIRPQINLCDRISDGGGAASDGGATSGGDGANGDASAGAHGRDRGDASALLPA